MVLDTERYPGGHSHSHYSAYEGANGSNSHFHGVSQQTIPRYRQGSTPISSHAKQHQFWSNDGGFLNNAASPFTSGGSYGISHWNSHPVKPSTGGYGGSYGSSYSHGMSHGQGHGSPNNHGHGGYGNSHGYGGGAAHDSSGYGSGFGGGHGSIGMSHGGDQRLSWIHKGIDGDEE